MLINIPIKYWTAIDLSIGKFNTRFKQKEIRNEQFPWSYSGSWNSARMM